MLQHVIRISVVGTILTGARAMIDKLVIVPSAVYLDGAHHADAVDHARAYARRACQALVAGQHPHPRAA